MTRNAVRRACALPTGVTSCCSSTRSSLTCTAGGMSPASSKNTVAPSASSNNPCRDPSAPVNAPRTWPNSSLSTSVGLSEARWIGTNGSLGPRRMAMNGPGDQLLAGAAFAGDQHRGIGRRDQRDALEHLLHGRAFAQQLLLGPATSLQTRAAASARCWFKARSITAAACSRSNGLAR